MNLTFTHQDLVTIVWGIVGAAAPVVSQALATLDTSKLDSLDTWAIGLGAGLVTAVGRYLWTYLVQHAGTTSPPAGGG